MDKKQAEYVAVDIKLFRNTGRDIPFDLFLRLSEENHAHVFSRATGLDYKRLAQYIQRGVQQLHVRREDEEALHKFLAQTPESIFTDPSVTNEKKIGALLNMTEQNMTELFSAFNINEETAQSTEKVIKSYVQFMCDSPKSLAILLKLVSHGDYFYYHSIAVAVFSLLVARATGQFDQRMLEIVGMGGFLHDIGYTHLDKAVTESATDLTPAQWKAMQEHPKLGLQMIDGNNQIPDEVRFIVYQHHEEPGGTGYPNSLRHRAIFYPARIVSVVDAFSALISKRPFRPAYTVDQAIEMLEREPGKYDRDLVKVVASVFLRQAGEKGNKAA